MFHISILKVMIIFFSIFIYRGHQGLLLLGRPLGFCTYIYCRLTVINIFDDLIISTFQLAKNNYLKTEKNLNMKTAKYHSKYHFCVYLLKLEDSKIICVFCRVSSNDSSWSLWAIKTFFKYWIFSSNKSSRVLILLPSCWFTIQITVTTTKIKLVITNKIIPKQWHLE